MHLTWGCVRAAAAQLSTRNKEMGLREEPVWQVEAKRFSSHKRGVRLERARKSSMRPLSFLISGEPLAKYLCMSKDSRAETAQERECPIEKLSIANSKEASWIVGTHVQCYWLCSPAA